MQAMTLHEAPVFFNLPKTNRLTENGFVGCDIEALFCLRLELTLPLPYLQKGW